LQFLFTAKVFSDKNPEVFRMTRVWPSGACTVFACEAVLLANDDKIGGVFQVCIRAGMRFGFDACRCLAANTGLLG
jgi:hypothetical protein